MRVLGLIPARGGSKGVPKKNIKHLGGKPLIAYSLESAAKSNLISSTVVSTDSNEIAEEARKWGGHVPFLRPPHLSTDKSPTVDTVLFCLVELRKNGLEFDAVCLIQPTTPFRPEGFIDKCINKFISSGSDSLISVMEVPKDYNPHWVFEPNVNGYLQIATGESEIITRRQSLPKAFIRDGSVYITKTEVLLQNKSLYGNVIAYQESDPQYYVNIDTMDDWIKAENML
uniref:acylneuraminate cytidylyltransferase family protein n=3 Tax=Roseivirga sp. TaxID=1964215 RepID=UPI00404856AC